MTLSARLIPGVLTLTFAACAAERDLIVGDGSAGTGGGGAGGGTSTGGKGGGTGGGTSGGGAGGGTGGGGGVGGGGVHYFGQSVANDLDILFMIDNSTSMDRYQASLAANFPVFVNVLKALPNGLPNLHVGVVSSSLGSGAFTDMAACLPGGDHGILQKTPRGGGGTCTAVPSGRFIQSYNTGTENNFTGDISEVFACVASLGATGCGFEHQLASVARALGANLGGWITGAPPENTGFLRPSAHLAVILLTNEDDCSAPVDSDLFDPKQDGISDPLGPLGSFRCNEFGHVCGGVKPPRSPRVLTDCQSAEGAGKLIPIAEITTFFKTLKPIPNRVLVSAIAAPPTPYSVGLDAMDRPRITPSCAGPSGTGDPGVRIKEFVDSFGANGTFTSVCSDDYPASLNQIAQQIQKRLGAQCLESVLADVDLAADGLQSDCAVTDLMITDGGSFVTQLPSCVEAPAPCWHLTPNPKECTVSGFEVRIDRGGGMPPAATVTRVVCQTCTAPGDPRCAP